MPAESISVGIVLSLAERGGPATIRPPRNGIGVIRLLPVTHDKTTKPGFCNAAPKESESPQFWWRDSRNLGPLRRNKTACHCRPPMQLSGCCAVVTSLSVCLSHSPGRGNWQGQEGRCLFAALSFLPSFLLLPAL